MQKLEIVREKIESKYRVVKSDVDLEWNRAIDLCMNIINAHISRENTPEITRSLQDNEVTEYCPHCDREPCDWTENGCKYSDDRYGKRREQK